MAIDILVIEDDPAVLRAVVDAFGREGWNVRQAVDGPAGLARAREHKPDVVVCDVGLPGPSGLEVMQTLQQDRPGTPVILLTARREEIDRVLGLELGAADYVTKPFSPRELVARVRARLRSRDAAPRAPDVVTVGSVEIDLRRRILKSDGEESELSAHEAGTLAYLIARAGRDVSRDELLEQVWGYTAASTTRSVDNLVARLRKKIEADPGRPRHILTVHGTGYRFEP